MRLLKSRSTTLAKGQVWKTRAAEFEILGIGQGFVHFKVKRDWGERLTSAQVSGLEPMANYLEVNEARLVPRPEAQWVEKKRRKSKEKDRKNGSARHRAAPARRNRNRRAERRLACFSLLKNDAPKRSHSPDRCN